MDKFCGLVLKNQNHRRFGGLALKIRHKWFGTFGLRTINDGFVWLGSVSSV
jgi:hypothetical protein